MRIVLFESMNNIAKDNLQYFSLDGAAIIASVKILMVNDLEGKSLCHHLKTKRYVNHRGFKGSLLSV